MHIPNDGSKAVAISLPRDSYVDIPGGYGKHKINSAYARAMLQARKDLQKQGVTDPKELDVKANQAGAKELISTVEALTGSTIDNYAAINLLGFSDITQAIGGVDVCLADNVNDTYSGANFTKGVHTISGVQALEFVRQRHGLPRGDLDRVVRQQVFMAGMARKVLSAGTLTDPTKLNALIDAIKKSVVLNQNWDIFGFAEQMKGLTGGQLEFRTIPVQNVDYQTPSDGSAIQVDPAAVRAFVQGLVPKQQGQQQAPPAADSANKATTVDVRNSSGRTGLAASVSKELAGKGFTAGDTANGTSRKTTVIWVPKGGKNTGQAVADALGTKATVQEDKSVSAGHVMIFLGSDYSPSTSSSGGSNAAGAPASAPASSPRPRPPGTPGATSRSRPTGSPASTEPLAPTGLFRPARYSVRSSWRNRHQSLRRNRVRKSALPTFIHVRRARVRSNDSGRDAVERDQGRGRGVVIDVEHYQRILGDELRKLRRGRGWTRKELNRHLQSEISLQTLATYELGTRQCSVVRLVELCVAMDELPQDLLAKVHRRVFVEEPGRVRVDLHRVIAEAAPELLPLRRWAEDRLRQAADPGPDSSSAEVSLDLAALERMAELCDLPTVELITHLRKLQPS